jgi:hypothetical protein
MDFYAKIEEKVLMSKIFKQYKMKGQGGLGMSMA